MPGNGPRCGLSPGPFAFSWWRTRPPCGTSSGGYSSAPPVLLMSGYTGREAPPGLAPPDGVPLLRKPFTLEELSARLQEVLAGTEIRAPLGTGHR